jgi:hypothetical protein
MYYIEIFMYTQSYIDITDITIYTYYYCYYYHYYYYDYYIYIICIYIIYVRQSYCLGTYRPGFLSTYATVNILS